MDAAEAADSLHRLTRRGILGAAAALAAVAAAPRALAAGRTAPALGDVRVATTGPRFTGDRRFLATVSPTAPDRHTAVLKFALDRTADVVVEAVRKGRRSDLVVWQAAQRLSPGAHAIPWRPDPALAPGTYLLRITVSGAGRSRVYGRRRATAVAVARAPVVRILGVEAAFGERSYAPGDTAVLRVAADARQLTVQVFRSGVESENTDRNDEMKGVPAGDPVVLEHERHRHHPRALGITVGAWPSGLYFARLTTEDGRVGFAPFVVRAATPTPTRVAVVLPTHTWQAYNFRDVDGDAWGDTWYAGGSPPVRLDRAFLDRGVPPRFRRYDLPFLRWLSWTGKTPDFLTDEDVARFASGDELRALYDLVVFPGHTEYVTAKEYDVVERYRDLGGNLVLLSANNFFWRVDQQGQAIRRVALWRNLGRPEARLLGSQYRANDDGSRQGVFRVTNAAAAPWLFAGTGLVDGSTFGDHIGGYGIEIDATTKDSPPGTHVVAAIPDLFGPGIGAEMTYYQAPSGAKVFAAGTLDFGGSVTTWPIRRLLENLWAHMTAPRPPA